MKELCREAFNAGEPETLAGYEFYQGVAHTNKKWLKVFIEYLLIKTDLTYEKMEELTGLTIDEIEEIGDVKNKMGAGVL